MKIWKEYHLQANKCPRLPETHGIGFPSQPLKVIDLTDALILHFQPSELWGNIHFCCLSHLICDALFLHLQGMNTAVCVCVCVCVCALSHIWLFATPRNCNPPGFSVHGIFLVRITRVGGHFLLQGIFLTQDWTSVYCLGRRVLYQRATWESQLLLDLGLP